jgi:hypothetical protein
MWITLFFIIKISTGFRKLPWSIVIGLFSIARLSYMYGVEGLANMGLNKYYVGVHCEVFYIQDNGKYFKLFLLYYLHMFSIHFIKE